MIHYEKALMEERDYITAIKVVERGHHAEDHCEACKRVEVQLIGGRPAKQTKGRGRPKSDANEVHENLTQMRYTMHPKQNSLHMWMQSLLQLLGLPGYSTNIPLELKEI